MKKGKKSRGVMIQLNRRIRGLHRDQGGQTIVLIGLILFTLALFFVLVVNTGHEVSKRFFIQHNGDAAALTGASWQARILNIISLINIVMAIILGIIIVLNAILKALEIATYVLLGLYIALQICCAIPYTAAGCCPGVAGAYSAYNAVKEIYDAYKNIAEQIMDALWDVLDFLSDVEDGIVDVSPYIPPVMANVVAYENARYEDPSISGLSLDVDNIVDGLGGFDLNFLSGIDVDSLVICWPLPPELPLKEGGIEDVCKEVREYVKGEWIDPLKEYGIGYIIEPIIDACISVTCEGGSGDYTIQGEDMKAAGCNQQSAADPNAPDCQSIYNGSIDGASVTTIKWDRSIKYYQCDKKCTGCPCDDCSTEYNSFPFVSSSGEVTRNYIPPISGTFFQGAPDPGALPPDVEAPDNWDVGACGWYKWESKKDKIGDDDGDFAFNEDPINGIDDDGDGLVDEDYIVYLCKVESWTLVECNYQQEGSVGEAAGTSENSDKVQPYILEDDWKDNNTVFYFTHFKKGENPLLPGKFKSPVRETIGSNAFASAAFFCNTTDEADCDMFHLNWKSKLVPVQTDSSIYDDLPGFLQDVIDTLVTH